NAAPGHGEARRSGAGHARTGTRDHPRRHGRRRSGAGCRAGVHPPAVTAMNEPLASRPSDAVPVTIASRIKRFVLWLGGSLAGITALLYAAGYLVTRSHLHMLGLYGFVEFDNDYF